MKKRIHVNSMIAVDNVFSMEIAFIMEFYPAGHSNQTSGWLKITWEFSQKTSSRAQTWLAKFLIETVAHPPFMKIGVCVDFSWPICGAYLEWIWIRNGSYVSVAAAAASEYVYLIHFRRDRHLLGILHTSFWIRVSFCSHHSMMIADCSTERHNILTYNVFY